MTLLANVSFHHLLKNDKYLSFNDFKTNINNYYLAKIIYDNIDNKLLKFVEFIINNSYPNILKPKYNSYFHAYYDDFTIYDFNNTSTFVEYFHRCKNILNFLPKNECYYYFYLFYRRRYNKSDNQLEYALKYCSYKFKNHIFIRLYFNNVLHFINNINKKKYLAKLNKNNILNIKDKGYINSSHAKRYYESFLYKRINFLEYNNRFIYLILIKYI